MHHVPMSFTRSTTPSADGTPKPAASVACAMPDHRRSLGHEVYIAGRYRNGAFSDAWTDVTRCAEGTFTAYAAACPCGWHGPTHRPDDNGARACHRGGRLDHHDHHRDRSVPRLGLGAVR
jgi:hypothetical protein|nr:hypothetical protein [Pseudonocardia alni]